MAITNNGTKNSLKPSQLPTGYSVPSLTTFTDYEYVNTLSLTVLKATVDESSAATTMAAIISNATIGITKQIDDILAGDFLATATVTAYADWTGLSNNFVNVRGSGDFLTNTAASYTCTVKLYIKTS